MKLRKIIFIKSALILVLGTTIVITFFLFGQQTAQPIDLGVKYSDKELESFSTKIGDAPGGIMAGGIPVSATFTNEEATAFLDAFSKKQNFPMEKFQIRFHSGSFEASGVMTRPLPVRGDVLLEGTITVVGPREIDINISKVSSSTAQVTNEEIEALINNGVRGLFDRFAPDERFLNVQKIEFQDGSAAIEGIFPLEFVPNASKIRF